MTSLLHSIRWRVQAWHAVLLLAVIFAFCGAVYRLAWDHQLRRIDRAIIQAERTLIRSLVDALPPSPVTGRPEPFSPARVLEHLRAGRPAIPESAAALFRGTEPGYAYFTLRGPDGRILLQSPNAPAALATERPAPAEFSDDWRTVGNRRETLRRSPEGLSSVFGVDITPEREELRRFTWSLTAAGLGVWLLGLLGGWWLAGRAIRPVQLISATATRIADGNLAERIDTAGTDSELDQLGRVLNASFDRLHAALEQQKQFTADASHELKTPVTILISETQRALKRDRSAEEYRAVIETCRHAAERMRRLTESLLILARQESAGAAEVRTPCDLAALVHEAGGQLQALAAAREHRFEPDLRPAPCLGDPAALAILVTNLIANAIAHHDRTGGIITLSTALVSGHAQFVVSDDGPGIPADDLPHIFERFYRVDRARTGSSGHTGLGLAIARTIARNHGGSLTAANNPGRGARFTLRLPAAGASSSG